MPGVCVLYCTARYTTAEIRIEGTYWGNRRTWVYERLYVNLVDHTGVFQDDRGL